MPTPREAALNLLHAKYEAFKSDPIAFIDETYRADEHGEPPFYVLSAVILDPDVRDGTRTQIRTIVGGSYWHTTEAIQDEKGQATTRELIAFLARYQDPCIVAVREDIGAHETVEAMRAHCLATLMTALATGGDSWPRVQLAIPEERRHKKDQDRDQHTARQARSAGLVSRHFQIFHTSPALEPLLWLPDLVCTAYRRLVTHQDSYADPLLDHWVVLRNSA